LEKRTGFGVEFAGGGETVVELKGEKSILGLLVELVIDGATVVAEVLEPAFESIDRVDGFEVADLQGPFASAGLVARNQPEFQFGGFDMDRDFLFEVSVVVGFAAELAAAGGE